MTPEIVDALAKLPTWMLVVVIATVVIVILGALAGVLFLIITLAKRAKKIGPVDFNGLAADGSSKHKVDKDKLEGLLHSAYDAYFVCLLSLFKRTIKVPEDSLSNNGDLQYIMSLVWQFIYGVNGKHSLRTILTDVFSREEGSEALDEVHTRFQHESQSLLEAKYASVYTISVKKGRSIHVMEFKRIISREALGKTLRAFTTATIVPMVTKELV